MTKIIAKTKADRERSRAAHAQRKGQQKDGVSARGGGEKGGDRMGWMDVIKRDVNTTPKSREVKSKPTPSAGGKPGGN